MIETSAELALHLGGEVTTLATCIRVIRRDGTVFAFTSGTADLSIDGVTYKAKGGFSPAAAVETTQSLAVDSLEIEAILDDDGITEDEFIRSHGQSSDIRALIAVTMPASAAGSSSARA